ncbi:MAG: nucleoside triphosphate pyrophosphohydrolase [Bacilli bacterium]|nr:nucleoside triphosphate pyrophosphohydrolase [Bacilli bacterium]
MEKVRIYDKLVRDRIPEVIESNGDIPIIRTLGKEEYRRELMWKLQEEVNEVLNANSKEQLIEELADVLEVLKSIAKLENKSMADVIEVAQQKKLVKGGFEKRIYLEKTISKEKK